MGQASEDPQAQPDNWGYDLLLYGNEQVLRGSDNGTLVAFAAIAFQQIRGKNEPHHNLGCGLLLFSVLMCAVIHFVIGNIYVGRAKKVIRREKDPLRRPLMHKVCLVLAWAAGIAQFICIVLGLLLLVPDKPPAVLEHLLQPRVEEQETPGTNAPGSPAWSNLSLKNPRSE